MRVQTTKRASQLKVTLRVSFFCLRKLAIFSLGVPDKDWNASQVCPIGIEQTEHHISLSSRTWINQRVISAKLDDVEGTHGYHTWRAWVGGVHQGILRLARARAGCFVGDKGYLGRGEGWQMKHRPRLRRACGSGN